MTFEDLIDKMNAGNSRGPGQWTPDACKVWREADPADARLLEALVAWELVNHQARRHDSAILVAQRIKAGT
jgi:hypothetical protein